MAEADLEPCILCLPSAGMTGKPLPAFLPVNGFIATRFVKYSSSFSDSFNLVYLILKGLRSTFIDKTVAKTVHLSRGN